MQRELAVLARDGAARVPRLGLRIERHVDDPLDLLASDEIDGTANFAEIGLL